MLTLLLKFYADLYEARTQKQRDIAAQKQRDIAAQKQRNKATRYSGAEATRSCRGLAIRKADAGALHCCKICDLSRVFYYCRTYYKAVRVVVGESGGHVL